MEKKINKFVFWTPRLLVILFVLFLAIFSLDIFGNNYTFWETVIGLFMHNLPSLVLIVILVISWKHELVGASIFGLLGVAGIIGAIIMMISTPKGMTGNPIFIITGTICLLIGSLFLVGWSQRKKIAQTS